MSSYIIAGSGNKPETGICEQIANLIKSSYKNIDFRIIIKHPNEWDTYIHEILRIYGFKKMYDPIIFTLDGKLIGGIDGLKELAETGFGIETSKLEQVIIPEINMKIVDKEVAAKKKLQKGKKTLEEKIALSLKQKLQNGDITCIEGYYKAYMNNGLLFYVKEETKLCPDIHVPQIETCEVVKEVIEAENIDLEQLRLNDNFALETVGDEDSKVDETIKSKQGDLTNRTNQDKANTSAQQQQQIIQEVQENQKDEVEGGETTVVEGEQPSQNQEEENQEGSQGKILPQDSKQLDNEQEEEEPQEDDLLEQVYENNSSVLRNLKKTLIKPLKGKEGYYLAFHPDPLLDGQILLFEDVQIDNQDLLLKVENEEKKDQQEQTDQQNENLDDGVYISDWSGGQKHRKLKKCSKKKQIVKKQTQEIQEGQEITEIKTDLIQEKIQEIQKKKFKSKLNRDILELNKPLSKSDWKKVKKILSSIDSVVTLQILPFGHQSHLPLSNNVLNVYLREFLTRSNRNQGIIEVVEDYNKNEQEPEIELLPFEKYVLELQGQAGQVQKVDGEFLKIPNLEFEHLIYMCEDKKQRKAKLLKKKFKQMIQNMYTEEEQMKYGFNMVITRSFMMLVPIRGYYGQFEGKPLYLNPISYLGYIHLPIITKIWPRTAYNVDNLADEKNFIQLLNNQINL